MKYVGEAVSVLQTSRQVVAFGIAPWGTVTNQEQLTSKVEIFYLDIFSYLINIPDQFVSVF
jgi:hypothetical protein